MSAAAGLRPAWPQGTLSDAVRIRATPVAPTTSARHGDSRRVESHACTARSRCWETVDRADDCAAAAVQSSARSPVSQHRLRAVHACDSTRRESPCRALVVGATGVARMRTASESVPCGHAGLSPAAADMDYLPVFLRLDARPVVVVGGG